MSRISPRNGDASKTTSPVASSVETIGATSTV